eukprot:1804685-Amphidinium_carterae.3
MDENEWTTAERALHVASLSCANPHSHHHNHFACALETVHGWERSQRGRKWDSNIGSPAECGLRSYHCWTDLAASGHCCVPFRGATIHWPIHGATGITDMP